MRAKYPPARGSAKSFSVLAEFEILIFVPTETLFLRGERVKSPFLVTVLAREKSDFTQEFET